MMIDIRLIRENPDEIKRKIATLYIEAPIDRIIELDTERRQLVTEVDSLKAERNEGSKKVARTKDADERNAVIADM
jgi:seryl-tRNA synthetase